MKLLTQAQSSKGTKTQRNDKSINELQRHKVVKAQREKINSVPLCLSASVPDRNGFTFLRNPNSEIRNENGMALVIVVAIIAILSSIGITFMYTMRMEEKTAFNYMNSLKASYIAKSGIEHAIAVLKSDGRDTGFVAYETNKWGYRNDDLTDSTFSAYGNGDAYSLDNDDSTITQSPNPSFSNGEDSRWIYVYDENGVDIVGRYAVLIIDESSKININTAGYQVVGSDNWDNSPSDPRQGYKPFEISLERFFYAGTQPPLNWSLAPSNPQILANNTLIYRYGDGRAGDENWDDNADSIILESDGIDNNADGQIDEEGEGIDDPYEFIAWKPYPYFSGVNSDTPFITIEETKEVDGIGTAIFNDIKPYITVYSSDENTTDSGFLRLNINLVRDATALYTVMYKAWEGLMDLPYPDDYSYEELKRLSAQCAVNTIDYADTDNVSTFLEISHEDTGLVTSSDFYYLAPNKALTPDEWNDAKITVVSPSGVKQVRTIDYNTANRVYITRRWDTGNNPPADSYYHIQDNAVARGAEAIRINEIMVKPAYQWEAEELFGKELVDAGEAGWSDTDLDYKGIYSFTTSTETSDPSEITAEMQVIRKGSYRVRALTYSSAPDTGTIDTASNTGGVPGEEYYLTIDETPGPWEIDQWESALVTIYYNPTGTGVGQERRVTHNDGNTLYISEPWTNIPAGGDKFSVAQDHRFYITLKSDAPDVVLEAGTRNIGGWLLEDLEIVEVKDAGLGEIVLTTTENTNEHNGAWLDYIQLSQQPDCEYVELINISDNDVNIGGWTLATSAGWTGTIPDDTIIEKRDYMVLVVDKEDNLSLDFDQDGVPTEAKDDIYFDNTWNVNDERVVQLKLSTTPINIAEDGFGDTIILSGSIFTDSPLEVPVSREYSGVYGSVDKNTLTVGGSPWMNDQWKGATIIANIEVGTTDTQIIRQITGNDENTVTISTRWDWSGGSIGPSPNPNYSIFFKPMAVTLYKGSLADQQIVSQVNYLAEDINRVCYIQESNNVPVYGFIALEKDDPTAVWDRDNDGIDDWWHINIDGDEVPTISEKPVRGGTPGGKNSVVPDYKDLDIDVNVPNLPFATVGKIKNVSRMRIEDYGWATGPGLSKTLIDTTSSWGDLEGAYILIASGKGAGQIREIEKNIGSTITVTEDWTTIPNVTSEYHIFFEWSKLGYDYYLDKDDIKLVQRIADKITVSQKRLDAENATYMEFTFGYPPDPSEASYPAYLYWKEIPADDTFLTPFYSTTEQDDTGLWIWGIDQRINPDTAIYNLYILGRVVKDNFGSPDTALVTVTTGIDIYEKEISFSPDDIADFGQITIGGDIVPLNPGEFLQLEMWKDYNENSIYFDAVILSPEYRTYGRININTADTVILQSLPGITGPIATAIVNYRQDPKGYDGKFGTKYDDDGIPGDDNPEEYNWPNSDDGPFNDIGEILNVQIGVNPAIDLDIFSKISNLITTKSKIFTIISTGQALRQSDKSDVTYNSKTYEILGEKKYMVVMER